MSVIKEEKKVRGKQRKYVNSVVREFDGEAWGNTVNLFGETPEEAMKNSIQGKITHLVQLGNLHVDRTKFYNPQDTRVYGDGTCPTLTLSFSPRFLIKDNEEYKTRRLTGVEEMRLMGVEDDDIQKLVDGGISNNQLCQLAGNSIIVDCMSTFFQEMLKH